MDCILEQGIPAQFCWAGILAIIEENKRVIAKKAFILLKLRKKILFTCLYKFVTIGDFSVSDIDNVNPLR